MKYLITGGAGFIGSALCRHLVASTSASVVNFDKLTYAANLASLRDVADNPRYFFQQGDVCDVSAVSAALTRHRPDGIIHLAAESHVDRSIAGPAEFIKTNILGTYVVLEAARAHWEKLASPQRDKFKVLHVSTDEVFGSLDDKGAFTESTPYNPSSPYSASKAAADHLAAAWHRTYGLPIITSNCSNNFGPYQFPEKLVPLMITNALLGRELPVYGSGLNVRDWLYVEDHAEALVALVSRGKPGESYNVGARCERTNISVVKAACDILDIEAPRADGAGHQAAICRVADRPGHDFRYAIDPSKIEREIGWRPRHTFETALERTVRWYIGNAWWWQPLLLRKAHYDGERPGLRPSSSSETRPGLFG